MAIIPNFSIYNNSFGELTLHFAESIEKDLYPLFPIINEHLRQYFIGRLATDDTITNMRIRLHNFLGDLVDCGHLVRLSDSEWHINIVEYVANQLGASVHRGEVTCTTHGSIHGLWGTNKNVLAQCLIDINGNLVEQMKNQPSEIIEWFADTLSNPVMNAAVEKMKNELILQVAHIR